MALFGFIADASVVIKWLHGRGEGKLDEADVLLRAHLDGAAVAHLLDLTAYEVGSALIRRQELSPKEHHDIMSALWRLHFSWLSLRPDDVEEAGRLSRRYSLSFYDASYLAVTLRDRVFLVTDDHALLDAAKTEGVGVGLSDIDQLAI